MEKLVLKDALLLISATLFQIVLYDIRFYNTFFCCP